MILFINFIENNYYLSVMASTEYTITNLQGKNIFFSAKNYDDFIHQFETNVGEQFEYIDLYWNNEKITTSRKFMESKLHKSTDLLMILSEKPVRLMDTTIAQLKKTHSFQYHDIDLWTPLSGVLEDRYGPIETWDVSFMEDMSNMFSGCKIFNQNISNWDVSSVEDMSSMFSGCKNFNRKLNKWDVSSVNNMSCMFRGCELFNKNISKWDVSSVEDTTCMFSGGELFNMETNGWDVLSPCISFNQDISKWDIRNVRSSSYMLGGCTNFNYSIDGWNMKEKELVFQNI